MDTILAIAVVFVVMFLRTGGPAMLRMTSMAESEMTHDHAGMAHDASGHDHSAHGMTHVTP